MLNTDGTFDHKHTHKINDLMRNGVKWGGKLMNYVDSFDKDLPFFEDYLNEWTNWKTTQHLLKYTCKEISLTIIMAHYCYLKH